MWLRRAARVKTRPKKKLVEADDRLLIESNLAQDVYC